MNQPPTESHHQRSISASGFAGTSVVVTGASSGIGREIAITLTRLGAAKIVVHYCRNRDGADETAAEIESIGGRAVVMQADLADADGSRGFCDEVFDRLGTVESWINNAGADVLTGDAASLPFEEKLRHLMEVDVIGTIGLSRRVAERMKKQAETSDAPPPSMVFTGWDQAPLGMEGDAGQMFGPVKAAVMAFANSLAQDLAPTVRVNTVAPGWIQTSWGEGTSEYWDRRAKKQSLMNRWGTPADVAAAVAFVADPQHDFTTGATIEVGGGWSRRFDTK